MSTEGVVLFAATGSAGQAQTTALTLNEQLLEHIVNNLPGSKLSMEWKRGTVT